MIGLWLAISGLIFGALCSYSAKKQERFTKNWFLIGFILGPIGLLIINILPRLRDEIENIESNNSLLSIDKV
jgi:hypothetical protein